MNNFFVICMNKFKNKNRFSENGRLFNFDIQISKMIFFSYSKLWISEKIINSMCVGKYYRLKAETGIKS